MRFIHSPGDTAKNIFGALLSTRIVIREDIAEAFHQTLGRLHDAAFPEAPRYDGRHRLESRTAETVIYNPHQLTVGSDTSGLVTA